MLPFLQALLIFPVFVAFAKADCVSCSTAKDNWCVETSQCNFALLGISLQSCNTTIKDAFNCPRTPPIGYEYSDTFTRSVGLPIIAAAYVDDPTTCLANQLPTAETYSKITVNCSTIGPATTCFVYTAVDTTNNAIIVSFRGTGGNVQLAEEALSYVVPNDAFFDSGHVYDFFYKSFQYLWNGGLSDSINALRTLHPTYSIWAVGHSLGGAQASIFASYITKTGLYTPENIKLLTFGQPRTGDKDFAKWHDSTFLYSYRVVHQADMVPHLPPFYGLNQLWHHRFEVWYNNSMTTGLPYAICPESDGDYCSNTQNPKNYNWDDHAVYFNVNLASWASQGCP